MATTPNQTVTGMFNGVVFTITPMEGLSQSTLDLDSYIGGDLGLGTQNALQYSTATSAFTITFAQPIDSLAFYALSFASSQANGYDEYTFS